MPHTTLIIGANRGIGLALCEQYLALGHHVIATCRTPSDALTKLGCEIVTNVDVTSDDSVNAMVEVIASKLNGKSLDIVIHNSGILHSDSFPAVDMENMKTHFDVNSLGPLRTVTALQLLLDNGSKVGIVSSRVGSIDDNSSSNNYAYRVSKTAVNMIGKCLSIDLAPHGIAVALLHPGYVKTDMTNNNGLITTAESAAGLIQRMDELTLENTGIFVHTSGEVLTW